ncbi:NADP-dependent oxidoreductase (plasmid) [Agrobacterium sp. rho-8.1]|nr:NADP-dependent oxidoreductase [Agrobacterium sp. rho-8.1]
MKSIRFHDYGGVEEIRVDHVEPLHAGSGEVLIDVAGAGVNPVDYKVRSGIAREVLTLSLPYTLGCDFSGTIRAVGEGVSETRIGERVMGMVSVVRGGAYAEQIVVRAEEAAPVPDGLDLVKAAMLPMGVMTGYDLIEIGLNVRSGERVIVTGAAGSVGRAAVYAAASRGAEVVAVVRAQPPVPISGAAATIVLPNENAITQAGPFDCVADTVGGELAESFIAHLRSGGRFCTVVAPVPGAPDNSTISIGYVIVSADSAKISRFANALASGEANLPEPQLLSLDRAAEAHGLLESGGLRSKLILIP